MSRIKIAIAGVGNCASSLIQGLHYYTPARCKLALDAGEGGVLDGPSAYFCKHPPVQYTDDEAYQRVEEFIDTHVTYARAVG